MREVRGTTSSLLLITHDMGVIWEMCERIVVMYASRVVETGPVQAIFSHPAHPYTEGLLRSIPSLAEPGKPLPSIKGQVPSLLHLPKGCAFADRCPYATPPCRESVPPLRPLAAKTSDSCKTSPQRQVACCFPRIS
jgi:peptide/nickel transport system ATP-binding protein/oligopeptide transport system ATP-binding protein